MHDAGAGDGSSGALRRVLGPFDATCIVIGAIIGVGIFFNPSKVTALAGSGSLALVAWAVGGAIALLGALTCAELGGMYRRSGAQYEILRDAYGPLPAFLFVFCNATAIQAGASAIIAIVCVHHAVAAAGAQADPAVTGALAAGLIAILALVNAAGVRGGSTLQNVTAVGRVAALLAVTAIAIVAGPGEADGAATAVAPAPDRGAVAAICAALVPAFFAYGGWQHALWIGGEVRDPQRNVPRAIVTGVLVVVAAYLLVNWAYLHLLGEAGVMTSTALAADAVARAWPGLGARLAAGVVALSALGVLNAQLLSGPRLVYGMARDGRFFGMFAKVHPRFATPIAAIALIAAMAIALLVLGGETARDRIVTGVVFVDAVFFAMTGLALVVLRLRRPGAERSVRVPGYPFVPILFAAGEMGVVVGATLDHDARLAWLIGAAWIAAGAILWAIFFRAGARGSGRPRCGACRYDLAGTPRPWTTCSECGADLTRPGAVAMGAWSGRS
jgi:APA family basic amino acid/polyamine antiporter